jgi:alkylation response protein AidB-like acyl-CoA dehydrogenase
MQTVSPSSRYESDERWELRSQIRRLLARNWGRREILRYADDPGSGFGPLAILKNDMALSAMLISEKGGGLGGGFVEVVVAAEELGAALAPSHLLGDIMTSVLLTGTEDPFGAELLRRIAQDNVAATVVWPGSDATWDVQRIETALSEGGKLSGTFGLVPEADAAAVLLIPTCKAGEYGVSIVDRGASPDGVHSTSIRAPDLFRSIARLDVGIEGAQFLALTDPTRAFALSVAAGSLVLAAEMLGGARSCLERTAEYSKQRNQFGKPIATYQAVKHRLVDMLVAWEAARAMTYRAADRFDCLDTGMSSVTECLALVRMAKASASDALETAARQSVQLHGAIGFTWENLTHFYLKRWGSSARLYGQPADLRAHLYEELVSPLSK